MNRSQTRRRPTASVAANPVWLALVFASAGCSSERAPATATEPPRRDASVEPSPVDASLDASPAPAVDANTSATTLTSDRDALPTGPTPRDAQASTAIESTSAESSQGLADASVVPDAAADAATSFDSMATTLSTETASAPSDSSGTATATDLPTASGSDPSSVVDCNLNATVTVSPAIGTVGIFTLTTNLDNITDGYIEFGPDLSYGMRANLNLDAQNFRTLLLGLTPANNYQYRVVVRSDEHTCRSSNQAFVTTPPPAALPLPQVTTYLADDVAPGFVVTSGFSTSGAKDTYVTIYNHHGEPVWWYLSPIGPVSRARIAWDGQFVYARDANPTGGPGGQVVRVSMDGLRAEQVRIDTGHHDMTVMPNNGFLFLTGDGRDDCGSVTYLAPNGELSQFYDLRDAFDDAFRPGADPCHCNSIDYNAADRSVSVSCLNQNAYIKLSEAGELMWVLGGNNGQSQFTGDVHWNRQHGHQFVSPTRLLFYNNNGGGDSSASTSVAVELELDLVKRTATRVWQYIGGETSGTLGDVQRLPNGNTLVTYSNAATIREVRPDLDEVQTWVFDDGIGYSEHRTSLYGSTPRN